jgi:hypothetical protein
MPSFCKQISCLQENVIVHCLFVSSKMNLLIINEVINGGEIAHDSKRSV